MEKLHRARTVQLHYYRPLNHRSLIMARNHSLMKRLICLFLLWTTHAFSCLSKSLYGFYLHLLPKLVRRDHTEQMLYLKYTLVFRGLSSLSIPDVCFFILTTGQVAMIHSQLCVKKVWGEVKVSKPASGPLSSIGAAKH